MPERIAKRVLIVGWDAADWKIIDSLFAADRLPNIRKLSQSGVRADLATLDPKLSPLLWTSIATGKTADKHGILHFVEPDDTGESLRISSSTTRKTKALWNILTQSGLTTHVINWYASHPAEPIRGVCVSNLFQEGQPKSPDAPWPIKPETVHPRDLLDTIAGLRLHPGEISGAEMLAFVPRLREMDPSDRRLQLLARHIAACASVHNATTGVLAARPDWDCAMVFFDTIDVIGHHFMQYYPPRMAHVSEHDFDRFRHAVPGAYQLLDMMLGALLEMVGPETTVIVVSDHGFHSDHLRPKGSAAIEDEHAAMDATWHRPIGVLAMGGPGISNERVYGATLLDIAPTVLTLLGVPVGADMDGRVLVEAINRPVQVDRVFGWDEMAGEAGMHPPDLRQDPLDAQDALKQLAELGYISDRSASGDQLVATARDETRFNMAVVYMTTRRVTQAAELFEELHRAHPDMLRYASNLARSYYMLGRFADARAVLDDVLKRHPDAPDAKILLGAALFAERKLEEASAVLEAADRETPDRPDLSSMLGEVYVFLKRWDDAKRVFTRAVRLDPHSAKSHHGLALVALNQQQFAAATEHCLTAVSIQHFYPDAHYTLGVALTWMKDYDHAVKSFQIALSMQPGLIEAHRFLASIHRLRHDRENAVKHRNLAIDLMRQRKRGQPIDDSLREPPMGPLEWAKELGIDEE